MTMTRLRNTSKCLKFISDNLDQPRRASARHTRSLAKGGSMRACAPLPLFVAAGPFSPRVQQSRELRGSVKSVRLRLTRRLTRLANPPPTSSDRNSRNASAHPRRFRSHRVTLSMGPRDQRHAIGHGSGGLRVVDVRGGTPHTQEAMTTSLLIVAATTVFAAPIGKGVLAFAPPSMRLENKIEEVRAVSPPHF